AFQPCLFLLFLLLVSEVLLLLALRHVAQLFFFGCVGGSLGSGGSGSGLAIVLSLFLGIHFGLGETELGGTAGRCAATGLTDDHDRLLLAYAEFAAHLLGLGTAIRGEDELGLVGTGAAIGVSGLDVNVGLFAQLRE